MKKIILISILSCLLATSVTSQDFAEITTADTLKLSTSVTYIQNDSEMNIWLGYQLYTENGNIVPKIAKWDGEELKIYSQEDDLEFGVVRSVLASKSGHVWLATATGIRKLMLDGTYIDYPLPQESDEGFRVIADGQNTNMVEDGSGTLFCNTELYTRKDLYNFVPNSLRKPEIWQLKDGKWELSEIQAGDNTINYNFYNDPNGGIITSYFDISLGGTGDNLFLINTNTNEKESIRIEDFLEGRVSVKANTILADENKIIISYKPTDVSNLYEGFSILDRDTESWTHFGSSWYVDNFPNLDFTTIPSALRDDGGNLFPERNWARKITPAKDRGYWLSMEIDSKADWLIRKGGGLLYFDGKDDFIRYSPGTHEGMKPFRPNPNFKLPFDGRDYDEIDLRMGSGVAYDKEGDLFVATLLGGLWVIPKSELPSSTQASLEEEANKKGFSLVPNIVSSGKSINLVLANRFKGDVTSIIVTDQTGRIISNYNSNELFAANELSISTNDLSTGFYYVSLTIDNVVMTEKFIVR